MDAAISTVELTRRFGSRAAVDRVSLHVPAGSVFALLGANGAGKTTTIKMLMNLIGPTSGLASVLGVDSRRLGVGEWRRIGYVSENQDLPGWMTPAALLRYCKPFYPTWDDALCRTLQADLGLASDQPLTRLSRGTRMKAALLASLAYRPELILLDEPFTGLDPLVRDQLVRALLAVPAEHPTTVVISSHDIDEVERLADWVGFLDEGRLLFAEPTAALLERFRLVEVIAASGTAPAFPTRPEWLLQGTAGRTLRFVDSRYRDRDSDARLAAAFPDAAISTSPLSLRDIFVTLARHASVPGMLGRKAVTL